MSALPPNILLITSDQQHWRTLGRNLPGIQTPNLDRLADQGTLFRRAYCPNPTCTPTRASILTGQQPSRHGAWSLGTKLPESATTVSGLLSASGYDTSLIGKAHFQPLRGTPEYPSLEAYPLLRDLDFWRKFHGPFYGFDHVELARNHGDECHAGQHYALWMEENGLPEWREHFQNRWGEFSFGDPPHPAQKHRWSLPEKFHPNAWIAERTNARIDTARQNGKPFFAWASFFDPHPPYLVPAPWDTLYDPAAIDVPHLDTAERQGATPLHREALRPDADFHAWQETPFENHGLHSHVHDRATLAKNIAVYYGMVSLLDKYIGRILDHLDAAGLADNTLVVFTSDHGHYYGQHGLIAKGPFHYEDGVRVPFIARGPGVAAGSETDSLASLIDLPPTFLRAAGQSVPATMQGMDLAPVFRDATASVRDHVLIEFRHQPAALYLKTLVEADHKLTLFLGQPFGELYNLKADPGETRNLWDDPDSFALREELLRKLLFAEMRAEPLWMPRIAGA